MSQPKVYLSRRNLLTLLSKLDRRTAGHITEATLLKNDSQHPKYPQSMAHIAVIAVEDDDYYADRDPGEVHPLDTPPAT